MLELYCSLPIRVEMAFVSELDVSGHGSQSQLCGQGIIFVGKSCNPLGLIVTFLS